MSNIAGGAGEQLLLSLEAEFGDRQRHEQRITLEQRADQVGLSFVYDALYHYESNAATHPSMLAVDLLLEGHPRGLILRGEPTAQFAAPPVYLHGAFCSARHSASAAS